MTSIWPTRSSGEPSGRDVCGKRDTGRDTGRCWEVCISMGWAPPFEFVITAIPVDLRIENSDNVPKGFYGGAGGAKKGPGQRLRSSPITSIIQGLGRLEIYRQQRRQAVHCPPVAAMEC